jgi:ABC-type multidrug transport system ATPase subunit
MVDGIDVTEDPVAVKSKLGYLPENAPAYPEMTVEETRRVFCFVSQTSHSGIRRFARKMKHRQYRNRSARLSHWRRSLGRRATPERLKRVSAGPVRSAIV